MPRSLPECAPLIPGVETDTECTLLAACETAADAWSAIAMRAAFVSSHPPKPGAARSFEVDADVAGTDLDLTSAESVPRAAC